MSKVFVFILSVILLDSGVNSDSPPYWDHDTSTLRLLQIVHRHGERNVIKSNLAKIDPFQDVTKYWPEGYGQLTVQGKTRMYRMGTYLRQWYDKDNYLSKDHSPRLVYARSSIEPRCIESVSTLLAGMYPPQDKWIWDPTQEFAKKWQPFPIETFMPKDEDTLLVPHKVCPKAQEWHKKIDKSEEVQKIINELHNTSEYTYMKDLLFKESIDYLYRGQQFWDSFNIETEKGYIWPVLNGSANYTQDDIIKKLTPLGVGSYIHDFNRPFLLKIRVGKLIETLISNMRSVLKGQNPEEKKELYIYSTHDTIVVPLMQAFGPYNNMTPPYGGGLLIELHQDNNNKSWVQIHYFNNTGVGGTPTPFLGFVKKLTLDQFEENNKKYYYSDFDKECGIEVKSSPDLLLSEMTFMVIGMGIGIGLLGLNIFAFKYIRQRKNTFRITK